MDLEKFIKYPNILVLISTIQKLKLQGDQKQIDLLIKQKQISPDLQTELSEYLNINASKTDGALGAVIYSLPDVPPITVNRFITSSTDIQNILIEYTYLYIIGQIFKSV